MKKIISLKLAVQLSLVLIGLLILFHLSIIFGILFFDYAPLDIIWGGKMETVEQLLNYEIISCLISMLFFVLVLLKSKQLNQTKLRSLINVAMWVLFVFFSINTIGNLLAETAFEKIFAILTAILAMLLLRIALERNTDKI